MTLANLIQRIPDWQTKTPEQLLAALSDPSILVEDHQQYTFAEIARIAGDVGASALCDKLTELGKTWAVYQLGGLGLDLANEEIQQLLYYLDSIGVPGMAAVAMSKRRQISVLEQAGLTATLQNVSEALDDLLHPAVPDQHSFEVLLSVNRGPNGDINAFASVTPVGLRDGKVVQRGEPVRHVNGALRDAVQPLIDALMRGD